MKSFTLLALGAGVAMAQQLSDLPACGQTCVTNMVNIAQSEFGCGSGDIACYCGNANFGYGVRDCTNESCPEQDRASVLSYGNSYCQNALASAGPSAASSGAASILSSAAASATATGGASGTGEEAQSTAISTQPLVGTITSDGSTILTTTGFSTIYSQLTGSAASAASSAAASASSVLSSASDSAASVISSAGASASSAASSVAASLSSELASATGGASGSGGSAPASSTGAAPKMTALPLAGAAGMAAWLFL